MLRRLAACCLVLAAPAGAQEVSSYAYDGTFADAAFDLEAAIVNRGLAINSVNDVGQMLDATEETLGTGEAFFDAAEVYVFCSVALAREMLAADPLNIAHCPVGIFVIDRGGEVTLGHRTFPEGEMQKVEALLESITREAVGE